MPSWRRFRRQTATRTLSAAPCVRRWSRPRACPPPTSSAATAQPDLIFRLVMAAQPRQALVLAPTFAEYAAALETVHCKVKRYYLSEENEFAVTDDLLTSIDEELEMVFLCQPNNPTGQLMNLDLVRRIAEKCAACGIRLVVDECFLDFLPDCEALTAKPLLEAYPNIILLKAFTKLYGMAGVRLGYCLCSRCRSSGADAGGGAAVGRVQPCTGSGTCGTGRDRICSAGACIDRAAAADACAKACGRWGCGYWREKPIICCFRHPKRWGRPCGRRGSSCAAAAIIPGWMAAGTAPQCGQHPRTHPC